VAGDLIVGTIETIVSGYWSILNYTVVPPAKMGHVKDHLKANVGSILFSAVLLLVAKALAGFQTNILDSFVLNLGIALISILVLFLIPTAVMLYKKAAILNAAPAANDPESEAETLSNRVSSVAIFIWIWSLIFLIADYSLDLLCNTSFISYANGSGTDTTARVMAVIFYTFLAVVLLLLRSWRSTQLSARNWISALLTVVVLGALNATMLYCLVYIVQSPAIKHVST
jgi:hypothetical protein